MKKIDTEIVQLLIEAGRHAKAGSFGRAIPLIMELQPFREINVQNGETWSLTTHKMPLEDIDLLARGLALADGFPGWLGGSCAAVIWVFRVLQDNQYAGLAELAEWIVQHDSNPYAPFGTAAHREERLIQLRHRTELIRLRQENIELSADLGQESALEAEHVFNLILRSTYRAKVKTSTQASALGQVDGKTDSLSRELVQAREEIESLRQRLNQVESGQRRSKILDAAAGLSPGELLGLVVEHADCPMGVFPAAWADVDLTVLSSLTTETRQALLARLADQRKGPWRKLYKSLVEVESGAS